MMISSLSTRRVALTIVWVTATLPACNALADDITWRARGRPIDVCNAVQKNVRFMYNARAAGASQTYAEMKTFMRGELTGKGEPEDRLRGVYEEVFKRIEADEFSPPKMEKGEGQLAARQAAGTLCLKAFPTN